MSSSSHTTSEDGLKFTGLLISPRLHRIIPKNLFYVLSLKEYNVVLLFRFLLLFVVCNFNYTLNKITHVQLFCCRGYDNNLT